jgi:hypothetical protein
MICWEYHYFFLIGCLHTVVAERGSFLPIIISLALLFIGMSRWISSLYIVNLLWSDISTVCGAICLQSTKMRFDLGKRAKIVFLG